jgi:myosin heavy subunit
MINFKIITAMVFITIPSLLHANQQMTQIAEQKEIYLHEIGLRMDFIEKYSKASKEYRKQKEYTVQEQKDYNCNLKFLYSDMIHVQTKYPQLEMLNDIQEINRNTEDNYQALNSSLKKLNVQCANKFIKVPVAPF